MAPSVRLGFVGAGSVGRTLAAGLAERGYRVVAVCSRGGASAGALAARLPGCLAVETAQEVADLAELVFLAVPDDAIAAVAAGVRWRQGRGVVHCSGAAGREVLASAAGGGARTGVFHPLQTFASGEGHAERLAGVAFCIEAEGELEAELEAMARALGGWPLRLPPGVKALYHASAVVASNYLVTLVERASALWEPMGLSRETALQALLPLVRGTLANLERVGLPGALTGPIARGDVGTVRRHLAALEAAAPELLPLYRTLGLETVPLARARGTLAEEAATVLREVLGSNSAGADAPVAAGSRT